MTRRTALSALAGALMLTALPVAAQYQGIVSLPPVGPGDSRLLLGVSALSRPAYLGAEDRVLMVLPLIDYANRNGFFASSGTGIGYSFINTRATQAGIRVIPQFGRRESDAAALRGMGDIDWGVEASAYLTQHLSMNWTLGANLRAGGRGGEFDVGARYNTRLAPTTFMTAFAFLTAANSKSQQTWYGVDAEQSLATGYAPFAPGAGFRNLQTGISANHAINERWILIGGISVGRLLGEAADSPIVREQTHYTALLALAYRMF